LKALVVNGSVSVNNPRVLVRYKAAPYSPTLANYADIAATEVSISLSTANSFMDSGWVDMVAGARADNVIIAVAEIGGDGAADPIIGNLALEFR
jgi:hypothetical protein